jgi:dipeptidyl aminopeptidase/acylaminoacyl peptidase
MSNSLRSLIPWRAWALGLLATVLLLPAAPTDVLNPHNVAKIRTVTSAALAPDGRHTAYTLSVPREAGVDEDGGPWTELWVVAEGDAQARPYVTGKSDLANIRWTPDGQFIGFLAKRGDDKFRTLYLLPAAGGEARRAFTAKADVTDYSFSRDGRRVAFIAREPETEQEKKLKEKGFRPEIYEEDWRFQRVWITDVFGTGEPRKLDLEEHAQLVRWSPVDDRLVLSMMPTPSVDHSYTAQRLRVVDVSSGRVISRIDNPGKLGVFEWSPDGRRIGFVAAQDQHDPNAGRLMIAEAANGQFREVLPPNWEGDSGDFVWLNDREILFIGQESTETFLGQVTVDGTNRQHRVALPKGSGAITGLTRGRPADRFTLIVHSAAHPAEVFQWRPGQPPQRQTNSNPWLDQVRLARQEVIRHQARDGLQLEGVLIRPLDEQPGRRYPLILSVHGGPEAHVMNGWVTHYANLGQMAAARGFAVFYPNYRGSTGRGVAFTKLGQGDPAGKEFDDLVDAVDHLIATGLVDAKKVGVTGGSYGGYATAWSSTRYSERFAAGVMMVGISNKISKVGTTDIPEEEFLVHALKRPWDDWQFMLERSPIYHAGNSRTPLLILHGKDDPRVDVGQSREMYRHMKLRSRAPVRLVLYPGEGHGNRRAASRLDYTLRAMQWFEHYLQGPGGEPPHHQLDYGVPLKDDPKPATE